MFQKTLCAWPVYSFGCVLPVAEALVGLRTVQFPDQTRFDFGLRSYARFGVRVYFATKLADGRNTTYVFSGLFPFTRRSAR
jgi:hypothetical protein